MPKILLVDPKSPFNVGGALRACHIFGASSLTWTGHRVLDREDVALKTDTRRNRSLVGVAMRGSKYRLPREERMKEYEDVSWHRLQHEPQDLSLLLRQQHELWGVVPVCVEVLPQAEHLPQFAHPQEATYLFGPEDGGVPPSLRAACHRFLRVPSPARTPLNLAVAVNIVLYDRYVKAGSL